ncbi:MAG: VOC family protein [Proteobacteria bacterium]|nr:VOC family protein [Pseudomonadota bacterium]
MSAIAIRGLDHVVLRVRDVERVRTFYCDVLGCVEERRLEPLGLYQLRAGDSLIDLVDVKGPIGANRGEPDPQRGNLDHFALELGAFDEAAIRAHLAEHGIEAGEVGERYGARGTGPSLYVEDPEGNVVELKGPATQPSSRLA